MEILLPGLLASRLEPPGSLTTRRAIVEEVRVATRSLATDDKDYVKLVDEFAPVAASANRRLGELIRRRKW